MKRSLFGRLSLLSLRWFTVSGDVVNVCCCVRPSLCCFPSGHVWLCAPICVSEVFRLLLGLVAIGGRRSVTFVTFATFVTFVYFLSLLSLNPPWFYLSCVGLMEMHDGVAVFLSCTKAIAIMHSKQ